MSKQIKKSIVRQHGQTDCGVACLASVVKYYGGVYSFDQLRMYSGTSQEGSTMLGLCQAAKQIDLVPQAFEGQIEDLKQLDHPAVLHVILHGYLQHYVVCYGYEKGQFIVGDPAQGLAYYTDEQLSEIWLSRALLLLSPTEAFVRQKEDHRNRLRWVLELAREDFAILGLALFLGLIITVLSFSQAIFSQVLIDRILPSKDPTQLFIGLGLLAVLLLFSMGLSAVRSFFILRQSRDFNVRIVSTFFRSLLFLPKVFFDTRKTGDFIARLNDTARIQKILSHLLGNVLIDVLVLLVSLVFVFFYSTLVGCILLGSIPIYVALAWRYNPKIVRFQQQVMEAYSLNESNYIDTISGIGTIKATGREPVFQQATRQVYQFFQQRAYDMGRFGITYGLFSGGIGLVVNLGITGLTAWQVMQGRMQLGELVALMTMASNVIPSVNTLVGTVIALQEARVAFDRMYEFTNQPPEISENYQPTDNNLSFQELTVHNIGFRFPGRKPLLKNVSFSVRKGEMIALLGESGAGKSTIMQMLQRFYAAESGSITINGQPWNQITIPAWRKLLGVVPQQIKLFNGSLLDNICLGNSRQEAEHIVQFCEEKGFAPFFQQFPQGYATILGEEGVNISGGQQQLVALARALYNHPQLLLLDEATSAMDRNTENFILTLLEKLKQEVGIILVTHRIKTAYRADRIYLLEQGETVQMGDHTALMKTDNFYSLSYRELVAD